MPGPSGIQPVGMPGPSGISPAGLAGSFSGSLVNDLASSDADEKVIQIKSDEQVALSLQEEFHREISVSDL